jgi:hypothetical protein
MLAYSGNWTRTHWLDMERKRVERQQRERREHRSLLRQARLLKDLNEVHRKLKAAEKERTVRQQYMRTLLRQWNRLVARLNEYNGTSQQVPQVEVDYYTGSQDAAKA